MTALYDDIGSTYRSSRTADPAIQATLAERLQLDPQRPYLDLACGTGNYTRALAALGGRWHGVDNSEVMLTNARALDGSVSWHLADAANLPFENLTFDGAICTLAIHHFPKLLGPFREVRRVLRSGSFVLFTGLSEQMEGYWLCHYFPAMMRRSIEAMPTQQLIRQSLHSAGFARVEYVPYFVAPDLADLFLYAGKDRPHMYLDPAVRANISSFARLCSPDELQCGVAALDADLRSGNFASVKAAYSSTCGDYAFFVAQADAQLDAQVQLERKVS
jgi:ubiquinone/menaquinone biosynthesis C-methylase UbiE